MNTYSLSHLSDQTLLCDLAMLVARDRSTTADLLAHLAEVDERKLYLPAAYPSMYAWCVGELRLCEQAAYKRIQAARAARRFPAIFQAVADGRLHLSAVGLLAAHLTEDNAEELIAAASHKSKSEIERLLAERFPRPDMLAWITTIPEPSSHEPAPRVAPGQVGEDEPLVPERVGTTSGFAPGHVEPQLSPGIVGSVSGGDRPRVKPLAPQRFGVQFTLGQTGHDKLRRAQDLLGSQVAPGDIAQVFERALDALIERLEKQKFAEVSKPRAGRGRSNPETRHIPAQVKRAVWERDGARCTFGAEFMRHKRIAAAEARAVARQTSASAPSARRGAPARR